MEDVRTIVSALIVNDGKFLLVESPKWDDVLVLPGGHIDFGESVLETAKREVKEELGVAVMPQKCVNVVELIDVDYKQTKAHFVILHISCELDNTQDITIDNEEITRYVWMKPEEALKHEKVPESIRESIGNYQAGLSFSVITEND